VTEYETRPPVVIARGYDVVRVEDHHHGVRVKAEAGALYLSREEAVLAVEAILQQLGDPDVARALCKRAERAIEQDTDAE